MQTREKMNKTKIDWGIKNLYTWNPVVGCKNGCFYCYAKKIRQRFNPEIPFDVIVNYDERLEEPLKVKNPITIFVGSMTDLFADWMPICNIQKILRIVAKCPQHCFIFLTKSPINYKYYKFPINCILGATITSKNEIYKLDQLRNNNCNGLFLSIEPILSDFEGINFDGISKIIVGAMTGSGAIETKPEWINSIIHHNVFYKNSCNNFKKCY